MSMDQDIQKELEAAPNAVLVFKVEAENGRIDTNVVPLGDVRATEVQTLLELGVGSWRRKIGLRDG